MKIPRSLIIRGKRWRVRFKPLRWAYGYCLHRKRVIEIDSDSSPKEQEDTFLHEVMHACLPERYANHAWEERLVRRLSPRLLEVLHSLGWVR